MVKDSLLDMNIKIEQIFMHYLILKILINEYLILFKTEDPISNVEY